MVLQVLRFLVGRTRSDRLPGASALLLVPLLPLACAKGGMQPAVPVTDFDTITCPTTIEKPTSMEVADLPPVMDYDAPPRPIKITRPRYPVEAFDKKIEGTVLVEILIGSTGRVVSARVIQSVPLLDEAAATTACQWIFEPAVKDGRQVPTIAHAPIAFRIH